MAGENIFKENDEVAGLRITGVKVFPFKEGPSLGHLRGLAEIVFNGVLDVRGLRIMEGCNGLFVSYPLDPFYKGEDFRSIVCPLGGGLREYVESVVLGKFRELTE